MTTSQLTQVSSSRCFGGEVRVLRHDSSSTHTPMTFSIFLPPQMQAGSTPPVLYWLSGLTCTCENFTTKAGAQRYAAEHGLVIVAPDTSPRGANIEGEDESYDLGAGAGFYLNATAEPWSTHYHMYDYVVHELPALIESNFAVAPDRRSIFGHSMGGHGALICALKNPGRYRSVSAFAPICAPTLCPWGQKAFRAYLGDEEDAWNAYDAHLLIPDAQERIPLLIDQGLDDQFLATQLYPDKLVAACDAHQHPIQLRKHEGYDHSYYFIASFIGEHIAHHANALSS